MHTSQNNNTVVWHSYTKCKNGVAYGIITKRINNIVVLNICDVYATRKAAQKSITISLKQLTK